MGSSSPSDYPGKGGGGFGVLRALYMLIVGLVQWLFSLVVAAVQFLAFLLSNIQFVALLAVLLLVSMLWVRGHKTVVENADELWRCELYPLWRDDLRPLAEFGVFAYDSLVCWTNALAQINAIVNRLLFTLARQCVNGADVLRFLYSFVRSLVASIVALARWIVSNPFRNVLPLYPVVLTAQEVINEAGELLNCFCQDLRPLFELVRRWLLASKLPCAVQQLGNGLLGIVQITIVFLFELLRAILSLLAQFGNPNGIFQVTLPNYLLQFEKINTGLYYLGLFGNEALQILICTIRSEIDAEGDPALVPALYATCVGEAQTYINVFGPLASLAQVVLLIPVSFPVVENVADSADPELAFGLRPGLRTLGVLSRFIMSIFTRIVGLINNDVSPPLVAVKAFDLIWDTLRDPPAILGQASTIKLPFSTIWGNLSLPYPSCNSTYDLERIPCAECPDIPQSTFEEQWCLLMVDLDELTIDVFTVPIFQPILCDCGMKLMRSAIAVVKFALDAVLAILNGLQAFGLNLGDSRQGEAIFDEIAGRPEELGGLLGCIVHFTRAVLDERLDCVAGLIAFPLKAAVETLRIVYLILVSLINSLMNQPGLPGEPLFQQRFCIGVSPSCINLDHVFDYLRKPRERQPFESNYNYIPINVSTPMSFGECLCSFIDMSFVNQFLDTPITGVPDLCCGIYFLARAVLELIRAFVEVIITILQMLLGFFFGSNDLITFEWLACVDEGLCSSLPLAIADLQDFLHCPCVVLHAIGEASSSGPGDDAGIEAFNCICTLLDGLANAIVEIIRAAGVLVGAIVNEVACIAVPTVSTLECTTARRALRWADAFDRVNATLDYLVDALGEGVGCTIGLVLQFDCVDSSGVIAPPGENCGPNLQCTPSERLGDIGRFIVDLFTQLIRIPLIIIKEIVFISFGEPAPNLPITISGFLREVLESIAAPVWGEVGSPPTTGLIQAVGKFLSCLIGPPGCITGGTQVCFGDVLVTIGNALRDLGTVVINLLVAIVALIEALFSGNGQAISDAITTILRIIFQDLLYVLVNQAGNLITFVFNFIEAILRAIIPAPLVEFFVFILNLIRFLEPVLRFVLSVVLCIFSGFQTCNIKRALFGGQLTAQEFDGFYNTTQVMLSMTEGTWCRRVLETHNHLALMDPPQLHTMGLMDEVAYKMCYSAAIAGTVFNAVNDQGVVVPHDMLYNTDAMADAIGDSVDVVALYASYSSWYTGSFVDVPLTPELDEFDLNDPPLVDFNETIGARRRRNVQNHMWGHADVFRNATFEEILVARGLNGSITGASLIQAYKLYGSRLGAAAYERMVSLANAFLRTVSAAESNETTSKRHLPTFDVDALYTRFTTPGPPSSHRRWIPRTGLLPVRYHIPTEQDRIGFFPLFRSHFQVWTQGLASIPSRFFPSSSPTPPPMREELKRRTRSETVTPPPTASSNSNSNSSNNTTPNNASSGPSNSKGKPPSGFSILRSVAQLYYNAIARSSSAVANVVQARWDHVVMGAPDRLSAKYEAYRQGMTPGRLTAARRMYRTYMRATTLPIIGGILPPPDPTVIHWLQHGHPAAAAAQAKKGAVQSMALATLHAEAVDDHISAQFLDPFESPCGCLALCEAIQPSVAALQFCLNDAPLPYPTRPTAYPVFATAPYNASDYGSDLFGRLASLIDSKLGINLVTTAELYLTNRNLDVFNGTVGFLWSIRFYTPIPRVARCDFAVHMSCAFGIGLKRAVPIVLSAIYAALFLLWLILPNIAGSYLTLLTLLGGVNVVFLSSTAYLAWGFNPLCLGSSSVPFGPIPRLPQCAADDLFAFFDGIFVPYPLQSIGYITNASLASGPLFPACNETLDLVDCPALGFGNPIYVFLYWLQRWIPTRIWSGIITQSCLVRGGCFGVPTPGLFHFLVDEVIPITNVTDAQQAQIAKCAITYLPVFLATVGLIIVGLVALFMFLSTLPVLFRALVDFFTSPALLAYLPSWQVLGGYPVDLYGPTGSGIGAAIGGSSEARWRYRNHAKRKLQYQYTAESYSPLAWLWSTVQAATQDIQHSRTLHSKLD